MSPRLGGPWGPTGRAQPLAASPPVTVDLLHDLWREQPLWSRTANRMKQRIERARLAALVLVVGVAVVSTAVAALAQAAPAAGQALAALGAVGAAVLPVLRPAWSGTRLRDWTRARSVSEALKSDVHLFLAGDRGGDLLLHPGHPSVRYRWDSFAGNVPALRRGPVPLVR